MGLTKDRWPCITTEFVQVFLDNPHLLDADDIEFVEDFFRYYAWWYAENGS